MNITTAGERGNSMIADCMPFEYGRRDGTILSEEEFYSEHQDIVITPA